ncbi:PHP domain-containing protein [Desulfoluna limicola]|nr:PHP domain-containing protein [Desulfoluna limicola]
MQTFRADLHLHTVLSPCGDVSMSPAGIVAESLDKGLSIIGITDHNSTRQCRIVTELAEEKGLYVLPGVELTTREEVHLLAYFDSLEGAESFQRWIDAHLQVIKNKPEFFGYQVVVDRDEQVVYEEERLLIAALDADIHETAAAVIGYNGMVICAHVDKGKNSLFSQLGIMPEGLEVDALEVAAAANMSRITGRYPEASESPFVCSSDAHYAEDIAKVTTSFAMAKPDFQEIRLALAGRDGRGVSL